MGSPLLTDQHSYNDQTFVWDRSQATITNSAFHCCLYNNYFQAVKSKNSVFNLKKLGEHTEKNLFRENGVVICIIKGQHGHTTCKSIVFYYYYIIIFF